MVVRNWERIKVAMRSDYKGFNKNQVKKFALYSAESRDLVKVLEKVNYRFS